MLDHDFSDTGAGCTTFLALIEQEHAGIGRICSFHGPRTRGEDNLSVSVSGKYSTFMTRSICG